MLGTEINDLQIEGQRHANDFFERRPIAKDLQNRTTDWFGNLPPVLPAEMTGIWRGECIPSGHPLDVVLENLHWFGKRFPQDHRADALLFQWRPGRLVPLDPAFFPPRLAMRFAAFGRTTTARNWFSYLQRAFRARSTTASLKLRSASHDETAAMVYDGQPIVDYFRRIGDDELAGMMIVRGDERRYFFRLRRVRLLGQVRP